MAEILVRINVPEGHVYSNNDIVVIKEDGHDWGAGELDTTVFRIVSISGSVDEMKYLLEEDRESPIDSMPPAFRKEPKLFLQYLLKNEDPSKRELKNTRRYQISENNKQIIDKRSIS